MATYTVGTLNSSSLGTLCLPGFTAQVPFTDSQNLPSCDANPNPNPELWELERKKNKFTGLTSLICTKTKETFLAPRQEHPFKSGLHVSIRWPADFRYLLPKEALSSSLRERVECVLCVFSVFFVCCVAVDSHNWRWRPLPVKPYHAVLVVYFLKLRHCPPESHSDTFISVLASWNHRHSISSDQCFVNRGNLNSLAETEPLTEMLNVYTQSQHQ